MSLPAVVMLCLASAIVGRMLLTRDQARRTIIVRFPALLLLLAYVIVFGLGLAIAALASFVGGSFYGLVTWMREPFANAFRCLVDLVDPLIKGEWE